VTPAPGLSLVVPVFERPEAVRRFHERLVDTWTADLPPGEVIYVDDGSTDSTWAAICDLLPGPFVVRGIRLARNAGQTVAMWVGWGSAEGSWLASLDADLEIDPSCLGPMWAAARAGADPVLAARDVRHVPWLRRSGSELWNLATRWTFRLQQRDLWCAATLMSRDLFRTLSDDGGHHRQFKLLLLARAASPGQVVVPAAPDDTAGYSVGALVRIGVSTYVELARLPAAFVSAPVLVAVGVVITLTGRARPGAALALGGIGAGVVGIAAGSRDLTRLPPTILPPVTISEQFSRPSVGRPAGPGRVSLSGG